MNTEKLHTLLSAFSQAVKRLEAALGRPKDEFIRDSAIQRFEFTFELSWKILKRFLEMKGLQVRTPRDAVREAFQAGLIPEDPGWLGMIELRNLTSHTYDEETAERIYSELPAVLKRFQALMKKLREELEKEEN